MFWSIRRQWGDDWLAAYAVRLALSAALALAVAIPLQLILDRTGIIPTFYWTRETSAPVFIPVIVLFYWLHYRWGPTPEAMAQNKFPRLVRYAWATFGWLLALFLAIGLGYILYGIF